jgi:hypothetical protein
MAAEKTIPVSFRVSPKFKTLLGLAAARENRSLTNTLETLLFAYCDKHGIVEPTARPKADGAKGGKK